MPGLSVWKWLASLIVVLLTVGCKEPLKLRLTVTPREVTVARGSSVTVNAVLETNDVPAPATDVTWTSALPTIAVVDPVGDGSAQITGVSVGAVLVTVDYRKAVKTTVLVTVTAPAITGLAIDPPFATVAAGLKTQLTAVGRLADGTEEPLTSGVTWSSSSPSNATIDDRGEITAVSSGSTTIMATYGELSALASVTITAPRLTALVLTPAMPDVPRGGTLGMTATGTFTDGSMRDVTQQVAWSSSLPVVATVSQAGIVTGEAVGMTIIAAQMSTVRAETTLRVTQPVLASIALTPVAPTLADGQVQQFVATGTFTDGATANVTAMATWSSTVPAVATVSDAAGSKGRVTAVMVGATIVRAAVGAITGETMVTVGPPVLASIAVAPVTITVPLGRTQQFTATGTYTDMSTMDLTAVTTWTSSATGIATVSDAPGSKGRATTVAMGTATITARSGTISGAATMVVGSPALESLMVTPADSSLPLGAARQMRAIGTMSNGTMPDVTAAVTWSSSLPARVSITNLGVARGLAQGAVVITAQQGTIMGSTSLTITPAELASIMILPATPSVIAGQTQQFSATGTWTDNTTGNITATATWASSDPAVATISNAAGSQGLATTASGGTTTISATSGTIVGSTVLTSVAATVVATSPVDGAVAIRPITPLSLTFSQPMDPDTLITQLASGPCAGSIQLSRDNFSTCLAFTTTAPVMSAGATVATMVPAAPLVALARYQLRVTGFARAASGVPIAGPFTQPTGFVIASDGECAAELVISQVYGGGGNAGAPILHDFVELHNPGPTPVALGGKALQLASASGSAWTVQALPAVNVPPGGYFLIQQAAGAGGQPPLANPDFVPAAPFALSATDAKVALTVTTAPLTGTCPLAATLDLVGYGDGASCFEGAAPVAEPASTTAVVRAAGGCTDLNAPADFAVAAPAPRNAMTAPAVCVCYVNETDLQSEVDYCNVQFPQVLTGPAPLTFTVFGRVYEARVTEPAGASPLVRMAVGVGPNDSLPTTWTWIAAVFNVSAGNDDEYRAPLTLATPGDYDFATRATRDGTNWTLCDIDGAGSDPFLRFDQFQSGSATVTN